ncbi:hypothetical protein LEP1GSC064_3313 [Leptospira kirschneri serovar Grippotyphosa str. Moskva]|nr:hypothetical protein LEP1GSC044_0691 [Leptospira kirschneri serovar Grippotyphosa str. RM52]EKP04462.1 hypothetical protein LEP1GSC018_0080 [Leptospira kirschneri str. 2008720114]EKQ84310.1 hypothetical protein LEP1GSC064_3313 [Leptospira kirschneri serovar Grippotyphosa str. Moskva]EKR06650.1 hypothetical protein LEP1GSC122_1251 [Leptospira kirschneri serovar Valbuzzi str. 200702274]EMK06392.1 hypothetical protein LEP1GSC176_0921 [Leptospira kirschneri str. MMD1493]EMK11195.1 hypothetical 
MNDDSFCILSSSHNFQSSTGKSTICESSHIFQKSTVRFLF